MKKWLHTRKDGTSVLIVGLDREEALCLRGGSLPLTINVNEAIPYLDIKVQVCVVTNAAQYAEATEEKG